VAAAAVAAVAAAVAAESATHRRALRGNRRGSRECHHDHGLPPCGGRSGQVRAALTTATTAAEVTGGSPAGLVRQSLQVSGAGGLPPFKRS